MEKERDPFPSEDALPLLREIEASMAEGVVLARTADAGIVYASPWFEKLFGYAPGELIGKPESVLHAPGQRSPEEIAAEIQKILRAKGTWRGEVQNVRKDGTTFWCWAGITTLETTAYGAVWVAVYLDITIRKRLVEQLLEAQKLETMRVLSANLARDFHHVLNVVLGYSKLVMSFLPEWDPLRQWLVDIQKAGEGGSRMAERLMAFEDKLKPHPVVLSLNTAVLETSKFLHLLVDEDIEFTLVLEPSPGLVKADPVQIERLLMKLTMQARDNMPRGGKLTISTSNVELDTALASGLEGLAPGPHVMVAVSDTGRARDDFTPARLSGLPGTAPEEAPESESRLTEIKTIIRQAGGAVEMEGTPELGSEIRIYLPRAG